MKTMLQNRLPVDAILLLLAVIAILAFLLLPWLRIYSSEPVVIRGVELDPSVTAWELMQDSERTYAAAQRVFAEVVLGGLAATILLGTAVNLLPRLHFLRGIKVLASVIATFGAAIFLVTFLFSRYKPGAGFIIVVLVGAILTVLEFILLQRYGEPLERKGVSKMLVYGALVLIALIWVLPTLGLLVSSFRSSDAVRETGWWTVLQNPAEADLSVSNYRIVLAGKSANLGGVAAAGETGIDLWGAFLNSLTVTVPATIIPILIAAFAAYGFAWIKFPGRRALFVVVVALLAVPLQIALIPILRDYIKLDLNGTFLGIWLAHTGFGLPLATYLLYNYISSLPRDILESGFIDGASHFTIFYRLVLPLSTPALASFAIFQFLWVWNDLLVALVFLGARPEREVLTQRLLGMVGTFGTRWHLLTAGAFISMLLPLVVFFALQRYFVRGLLTGSVKG
jgi:alpha-glucoside transport system permease protein